jgi:hypothetical protein
VTAGTDAPAAGEAPAAGWESARARFPARARAADWPATRAGRDEVWRLLTSPPFTLDHPASQGNRTRGLTVLLDWLADQPGDSWQQRWLASGADAAGGEWSQVSARWMGGRGQYTRWRQGELGIGLRMAVSADLIRPSLRWLVAAKGSKSALAGHLARARDAEGFAHLRALCGESAVTASVMARTLSRTGLIVAAKGGLVRDITAGDVLELLDTEAGTHASSTGDTAVFYRLLRLAGSFGPAAPETLRALRTLGQRTPQEMIDRYHLACRPVRDLLVDYLRERQPAVDYITLESLARSLGRDFWQDLERHHPGICTLQLPPEAASSWKQRRRTKPRTVTDTGTGEKTAVAVPRLNHRECLTRVRAFYLDIAQWAAEDPARWGPWVARCPVSAAEINQRKAARHRKSRMDARTRERLPVLPALIQAVSRRRKAADALLRAARATPPGQAFSAAGQTLTRSVTLHATSTKVWADDPAAGRRRDLTLEEDHAFWSWAIVEVLRATGVRIEELLEVTHYSLVQYRLPTTGELVPLLQIAPSKTDTERLLVVSPDMADVLSAIISRLRSHQPGGAVPLVPAYDSQERTWLPPSPVLFQRRFGSENRRISAGAVRDMLNAALADAGLAAADGSPLRCTPHDFRRIFITDAIMSGLPPHITQIIAGHKDINVTLGYKAVYPDEAIQAHLAFLARRRALRPGEEYRVPTDAEWAEFLGHFERRKVATGTCGRAFGTPCIHEHSCLRCSMHWPDPAQRPRIAEIRQNLTARIAEAEREGWLGEIEGLKVSLVGADDKLAQIDRRLQADAPVNLGLPVFPEVAAPARSPHDTRPGH